MNTITSLDQNKVHILSIPEANRVMVEDLHSYISHVAPNLKLVIVPVELTGLVSREMTDKEFEELKEAITPKKSVNDILHTPLN